MDNVRPVITGLGSEDMQYFSCNCAQLTGISYDRASYQSTEFSTM